MHAVLRGRAFSVKGISTTIDTPQAAAKIEVNRNQGQQASKAQTAPIGPDPSTVLSSRLRVSGSNAPLRQIARVKLTNRREAALPHSQTAADPPLARLSRGVLGRQRLP